MRVLEIALLPEYRGRGIGRIVMMGLCLEAAMRHKPVRLYVHYLSRAQRFYRQLGFREIAVEGPDRLMEWRHPQARRARSNSPGLDRTKLTTDTARMTWS